MLGWLRRLAKREQALTGAPVVRRMKSYSAASGYVYQYFYEGHRPAVREGEPGAEYVFQVSADRRTYSPLAVLLADAAVDGWQRANDRELNSTERYAIVKIALFQAFDERSGPTGVCRPVLVRPADLENITEQLGFV